MTLKLMKYLVFTLLVFLLITTTSLVEAAGECGKLPIASAALSLSPCLGSTKNVKAKVPPTCCTGVNTLIQTNPSCLCAIFLSPIAKQAQINPAIAITIPKRCGIKNRSAGKKCGKYTVP